MPRSEPLYVALVLPACGQLAATVAEAKAVQRQRTGAPELPTAPVGGAQARRRRRRVSSGPFAAPGSDRAGRGTTLARLGYGALAWGIAMAPTKCSWKRGSIAVSIFSMRRT